MLCKCRFGSFQYEGLRDHLGEVPRIGPLLRALAGGIYLQMVAIFWLAACASDNRVASSASVLGVPTS